MWLTFLFKPINVANRRVNNSHLPFLKISAVEDNSCAPIIRKWHDNNCTPIIRKWNDNNRTAIIRTTRKRLTIFWSYSNQKVIFWFIYFYSICFYTIPLGCVGSNHTSDNSFLWKFTSLFLIHTTLLWQNICLLCLLCVFWTAKYTFTRLYYTFTYF